MTLFTAEGLLRADVRGRLNGACDPAACVRHAYSRWLHTQGEPVKTTVSAHRGEGFQLDGWLIQVQQLFARRAPGNTCLSALRSGRFGSVEDPLNDSKGCGGVMRAAPAGLMAAGWGDGGDSFRRGCEIAALTHGHPSGYLAAGFLALAIERLAAGDRCKRRSTRPPNGCDRSEVTRRSRRPLLPLARRRATRSPARRGCRGSGRAGWRSKRSRSPSTACAPRGRSAMRSSPP